MVKKSKEREKEIKLITTTIWNKTNNLNENINVVFVPFKNVATWCLYA